VYLALFIDLAFADALSAAVNVRLLPVLDFVKAAHASHGSCDGVDVTASRGAIIVFQARSAITASLAALTSTVCVSF
jgi:hypothetical protein